MKKMLLLCAVAIGFVIPLLAADDENAAIIAATKTYVAANSSITKINATVEATEGDFARVKITPEDPNAADPAWVFLKKKDGKWSGVTLGSGFTTEDYQQLGIPNALRIP
jgi:hypothetical protein